MNIPTSTDTIKRHISLKIEVMSRNGEYTSDTQLKRLITKTYNANPLDYGFNKDRTGPSQLETIQGTRRSALTYVRKLQDGENVASGTNKCLGDIKGLRYITDEVTGEHYYYIDGVLQLAQLRKQNDPDYVPSYTVNNVQRSQNIHTTLQYELCDLGVLAGYNVFVPLADRNKVVKDGQTIGEDFTSQLVDTFEGMNTRSDDIDCLWVDSEGRVVKAFEVENSTKVDSGLSRMSSLPTYVNCYIIGTKDNYKKKFVELINTSYKDSVMNFVYLDNKLISREYNSINEHSDAYDQIEVRQRLGKKFK